LLVLAGSYWLSSLNRPQRIFCFHQLSVTLVKKLTVPFSYILFVNQCIKMSGFSVSSFFLIFFSFTVGESEQSEMLVCTTEQAEQASQHSSLAAFASFAVQAMERQNRPSWSQLSTLLLKLELRMPTHWLKPEWVAKQRSIWRHRLSQQQQALALRYPPKAQVENSIFFLPCHLNK
jgi:hypothetical protein